MGMTAARHARDCVEIAEQVVAMEALCAAQALDLRSPLAPGASSAASLASIRESVPFLSEDRELGDDIAAVTALVREGGLAARAREAVVGDLL